MIWLAAILGIALICLGGCAVIVACQAAYARGYRRGCDDGFWHRTQAMTGEFRDLPRHQASTLIERMEAARPLAEPETLEGAER